MALAAAAAGATVVITGRTAASLEAVQADAERQGLAGRIVPVVADLASEADMELALARLEAEAGGVHGWVNNAYSGVSELLGALTREGVEATLEMGLAAVMVLMDRVAARMADAGGGSIVNIASMYGMVSPDPAAYAAHGRFHNPPAYGAAKAGLIQLTRYAAVHLASQGVRVNCVSPGPFPSPAVQAEPGFVEVLAERVPLGRIGQPDEIAPPVLFLLGAGASYITGHNLVVDGGWTIW